ncbi:dimethylhistidine N-methyltransferase [Collimonas arenae]|uniref:Dimethylhistidine N-methyltransferase n=1 Tax=Collimonas arenae TaxID=279058 RepID=A0A127PSQ8_9BURK|nr:L-histidine N(alpha)-methyltransferase [Collimonas arenae]AMP00749.1 dimethylhistidine N-methyltransferase [Collimonas arenae]AMP10641.1 dimethylhistidine N-methyltransferase [Collimonas arenae]
MAQLQQSAHPENCVAEDEIQHQLVAGLLATHAHTSPKYLYDVLGSRLFAAICELPEYYPTRTEAAIFRKHAHHIAAAVGRDAILIDLGAGNCSKAARLFPALQPRQYVPIDISVQFLQESVNALRQQFPQIEMTCLGMDFSTELELPPSVAEQRRQFFYPGSSIGNFSPLEALKFLRRIRKAIPGGDSHSGLLIGVDLIKDHAILNAAYDDSLGVTAAFNLNLLHHVNRLLDADFRPSEWRHRGFYNPEQHRIEMHLEARDDVTVHWQNGGIRRFARGERIHTESSYKYTEQGFIELLHQAGFGQVQIWHDPRKWFMVCHAQAA